MKYEKGGLIIQSDMEIRTVREDGEDIDIIIPFDNRTVNLYLEGGPNYLKSRLQFPMIKNIIIRFCTLKDSNICTIHFLRSIDLHSSVVNFEVDYKEHYFEVRKKDFLTEIHIKRKEK